MKKLFRRTLSLLLALLTVITLLPLAEVQAKADTNNPFETLRGVFLTSVKTCKHTYGSCGKCSACGDTYNFLATRVETSALLQPSGGTIWVMDVPYSADSGGYNLLDSSGAKIASNSPMYVSATVTNAYGNKWCEIVLEDGRVGYACADGVTVKQETILKFEKLVLPKRSVFKKGDNTGINVKNTKIVSTTAHPIKTVTARILKVDAYGNEIALSDFSKSGINKTSYKFPNSVDSSSSMDLLSFSSLKNKPGSYIYEIVVTADPGKNADQATIDACTLTMRYAFLVVDATTSRILTLHRNDGTGTVEKILVSSGDSIVLPSEKRAGHTLAGWAGTASATTAEKKPGESLKLTADQELYAVWTTGTDLTEESLIMPGYGSSNKSPSSYKKAVTYADVEAIVKDYYNTVTNNGKKTVYWNAKNRSSIAMETAAFTKTVTTSGCHVPREGTSLANVADESNSTRRKKHSYGKTATKNGKEIRGCTSNLFAGVGSTDNSGNFAVKNDAQCSGFASYMAYVVFRTCDPSEFVLCYGTGANSLAKKANNEIKPGSVMRYNGHSYFIYKVQGDKAYCIECNTGTQDCKIVYKTRSVKDIKENIKSSNGKTSGLYSSPAKKNESKYTIAFDANVPQNADQVKGTMQPLTAKADASIVLPENAFVLEGYTFEGWNTKADGSGTSIADKQSVKNLTATSGATVTLYAQWKAVEKTYTIQYNGNGGVGVMPITNLSVGIPGKLSRNAYQKDACVFLGWNTEADGSGEAYTDQQEVLDVTTEDKSVVTLYAQWREMTEAEYLKNCTKYASHMKLTASDGQIMTRPVKSGTVGRQLTAGETLVSTALYKNASGEYWYQVRADRDGKTGFVYAGNAKNNGIANKTVIFNVSLGKTNIPKGEKCNIKGSVSAQHNMLYELTGKLNDSDPNTAEQTAATKTGFSSLVGTAINNNLSFGKLNRGDGTLVLTAKLRSAYSNGTDLKWEEYTTPKHTVKFCIIGDHPVTYDPNTTDEVTNMPAQQKKTDKKELTLAAEIPNRAGYTFLGWATAADALEPSYQPGAKYTEDAPLALYALWQRNDGETVTYTVSYTADQEFYGMPDPQIKTQGTPLTLSSNVPWSQYYTFKGWQTEIDGQTVIFQPGDTFTEDRNITLTALWEITSYLYDANGGTYWELGESFREVSQFDTTGMYHITVGFRLSDKLLAEYGSVDAWLETDGPTELGSWDFVPVQLRNGKLDFYVSPGTWITLVGIINCNYTFTQSENIVLDVQMLTMHGNGGLVDENDPLTDTAYCLHAIGHPQNNRMFTTFTRAGYTLIGWNTDPASSEVIYATDATWSQLDPNHTDLYAVWQQNEEPQVICEEIPQEIPDELVADIPQETLNEAPAPDASQEDLREPTQEETQ